MPPHWISQADAPVDLAYTEERIAIEMDSFRWHAGKRAFRSDRSRGNRIAAAGWQVARATPGDLNTTVEAVARLKFGFKWGTNRACERQAG